jgi:hypothetical protein
MRIVVAMALAWTLACAGVPTPVQDVAAPEKVPETAEKVPEKTEDPSAKAAALALEELLDAEPVEEPDTRPDATREARLREIEAFVAKHPGEALRSEALGKLQGGCASTVEEAYAMAEEEAKPRPPADLPVEATPWRVLVVVSRTCGTSEDWGWFSAEVTQSAEAAGIETTGVYPGDTALVLKRAGAEVSRLELGPYFEGGVGYLVATEGKAPEFIGHAMTPDVLTAASAYFGTEIAQKPL